MAKLKITSSTDERPDKWWDKYQLDAILQRLPETISFVSDIYKEFDSRDLDFSQVNVTIRNGEGWCRTGEEKSCDVIYIIEAPADILVRLITEKDFRFDYLDGMSMVEALSSGDLILKPDLSETAGRSSDSLSELDQMFVDAWKADETAQAQIATDVEFILEGEE